MTTDEDMVSSDASPEKEVSSGHTDTCKLPIIDRRVPKKDKSLFGTLYKVTDPVTLSRLTKYFL